MKNAFARMGIVLASSYISGFSTAMFTKHVLHLGIVTAVILAVVVWSVFYFAFLIKCLDKHFPLS